MEPLLTLDVADSFRQPDQQGREPLGFDDGGPGVEEGRRDPGLWRPNYRSAVLSCLLVFCMQ